MNERSRGPPKPALIQDPSVIPEGEHSQYGEEVSNMDLKTFKNHLPAYHTNANVYVFVTVSAGAVVLLSFLAWALFRVL